VKLHEALEWAAKDKKDSHERVADPVIPRNPLMQVQHRKASEDQERNHPLHSFELGG